MADLVGQRIGNYEITSVLGKGGMAVVYRARQLTIQREVAIKVIKPDLSETDDLIKRFEREANTVTALSHPHILKLFDFGQYEGMLYLVMELMPGGTLADLIRERPLSPERAAPLLDQVAGALDYAHGRGLIHRDLKPQNILLDRQGNAHLTDFGIAKRLGESTVLTKRGAAIGTPAYMPPEQWQGLQLTPQADLYSLGAMLYEMLTSRLPFTANTPVSMMYSHLQELPPSVRSIRADLPEKLDDFFAQALAKTPEQRFGSAGELRAAFKSALLGQRPLAQSESQPSGKQTPPQSIAEQATSLGQTAAEQTVTVRTGQARLTLAVGALAVVLLVGGFLVIRTTGTAMNVTEIASATAIPSSAAVVPTTGSTSINTAEVATASHVPTTLAGAALPTPTFDAVAAAKATNIAEALTAVPRTATFNAGLTATAVLWTPTVVTPTRTPAPTVQAPVATASPVPTNVPPSLTPSATKAPTFDPIVAAKATGTAEALTAAPSEKLCAPYSLPADEIPQLSVEPIHPVD
jgi:serine/threonine protein kinase